MSMARQVKVRWGALLRALSNEVMEFAAEYARTPSEKRFWAQVGGQPRQDTSAGPADPHQKRRRWLELWCKGADMIAASEAEHVRSAPHQAAWASRAAEFMRARLLEFQRKLRVEHADMPEVEELRLDTATGKYHPRVSALDALEALHYCIFEDPDNAEDDAAMTDVERAEHAAAGRHLRELLDSHPDSRSRLLS